jgi:hypothetical protein
MLTPARLKKISPIKNVEREDEKARPMNKKNIHHDPNRVSYGVN